MDRKHIPCSPDLSIKPSYLRLTSEAGSPPLFRCPNGHNTAMRNHTVDPDGTVNGSVKCPLCDYHEFVILDGWNQESDLSCP
jgi:hypothetical protein